MVANIAEAKTLVERIQIKHCVNGGVIEAVIYCEVRRSSGKFV